MSIRKLNESMNIISMLDDEPNDEGGLSASELKAKFDEGAVTIKSYINDTLIPDVDASISEAVNAATISSGNMPLGGKTGQALIKRSDADFDTEFVDFPNPSTTASPNTMLLRDANGRAQIAAPSAAEDIANKAYVDENAVGISNDVAANYGLAGTDATVGNALNLLSFATQYAWTRQLKKNFEYVIKLGAISATALGTGAPGVSLGNKYTATTAVVNQSTGKITYEGLETVAMTAYPGVGVQLQGKYWATTALASATTVYYSAPNAAPSTTGSGSSANWYIEAAVVSTVQEYQYPEVELLYSPDPDAYPKENTDEYYYRFLDRFDNLPKAVSAVTGTYTGNGEATRNIKLGFQPRAILVWAASGGYSGAAGWKHENGLALLGAAATAVTIDNDGITVFYTANTKMTNTNGTIYNWIAFR